MFKALLQKIKLRRERRQEMTSDWLRQYFKNHYGISVGLYSYGCFDAARFPKGIEIGRYCSFSTSCVFLNGNHGLDFISLHPYLYNVSCGLVASETITRAKFIVEDDVWVGHNAIILPSVKRIGRGAVIAAGAVVTKDVEPYQIVAGVPAKATKMRFTPDIIVEIEKTQWWTWTKERLAMEIQQNPERIFKPKNYFKNVNAPGESI